MRKSRPERFDGFVAYLKQYYPSDHPAIAIYTPPHPLVPADVLRFRLHEMPAHADRIHAGLSLYLPGRGQRPIQDFDLLAKVDNAEHLEEITK